MLWESRKYFLLVTLAAFALRLFFYFRFPHVTGDSLIYGDIAKNWLDHGIFGLSHAEGPSPTWIRLPGYPAFLAACFVLFGREHYHAVLLVQIVVDVAGCFFIADLARRTCLHRNKRKTGACWGPRRAGRFAFLLAALCPFTANYTVAPLAETLSIFFTAVALDCAVAAFMASDDGTQLLGCLDVVRGRGIRRHHAAPGRWHSAGRPSDCSCCGGCGGSRRSARVCSGRERWCWRSPSLRWCRGRCATGATSTASSRWRHVTPATPTSSSPTASTSGCVPGSWTTFRPKKCTGRFQATESICISCLRAPSTTQQQREQTQAIFSDYHKTHFVGPELNARFAELANERIRQHPLRYYVWLPMLRIADMWLRPRTEMLPLTSRWWEYWDDAHDFTIATLWGALNLLFLLAAVMGVVRGPRPRYLALMLLFVLLRSAFLGTMENPEPRYTLECYPVVFVLGAAWIAGWKRVQVASATVIR